MSIFKRSRDKNNQLKANCTDKNYFQSAQCWHYDRFESQLVQANRWLLAFWCQTAFSLLLIICLCLLLPLKTLVPLIIRQNSQTQEVFVEKIDRNHLPNQNEIESDLVRYVILRETYSSVDLSLRYKQVLLETNKACAGDYQKAQANTNPQSPVNLYGSDGIRTIHVEDVVFLNDKNNRNQKDTQSNIAKIDFVSTETINHQTIQKYWVATISWEYRGTPTDKEAAWNNWNGFSVTYYRVDQRSVHEEKR